MNERIRELAEQAGLELSTVLKDYVTPVKSITIEQRKFANLIVKEMCDLMKQAEDDAYHCFEPSERPTEYIKWLYEWIERFEEHFGVEK